MSKLVTEPNRRPSTPAFCSTVRVCPASFSPSACAAVSLSAAAFSRSTRRSSNSLIAASVARRARLVGIRKLRAKPSLTLTTSPRLPRLTIFSSRITCMSASDEPPLGGCAPSGGSERSERGGSCFSSDPMLIRVRNQRQEARALDRRGQLALVERTRAGQAGRRDLAVLADEVAQRVDILVVDLLDAGDRKAAEALAAEQQRLLIALGLAVLREPAFTSGWWHGVPLSIQ